MKKQQLNHPTQITIFGIVVEFLGNDLFALTMRFRVLFDILNVGFLFGWRCVRQT